MANRSLREALLSYGRVYPRISDEIDAQRQASIEGLTDQRPHRKNNNTRGLVEAPDCFEQNVCREPSRAAGLAAVRPLSTKLDISASAGGWRSLNEPFGLPEKGASGDRTVSDRALSTGDPYSEP